MLYGVRNERRGGGCGSGEQAFEARRQCASAKGLAEQFAESDVIYQILVVLAFCELPKATGRSRPAFSELTNSMTPGLTDSTAIASTSKGFPLSRRSSRRADHSTRKP